MPGHGPPGDPHKTKPKPPKPRVGNLNTMPASAKKPPKPRTIKRERRPGAR